MSELTQADIKWMARVQKALDSQPKKSKVAFFTIGDNSINAYDVSKCDEFDTELDFGPSVVKANADFDDSLVFKFSVESTAG